MDLSLSIDGYDENIVKYQKAVNEYAKKQHHQKYPQSILSPRTIILRYWADYLLGIEKIPDVIIHNIDFGI